MNLDEYLSRPGAESTVALARALGLNPDQLRQWRYGHDNRRPAPATCAEIERETGGVVTCEDLRPDITWARMADKTWPHKRGRPLVDVGRQAEAKEGA